MYKKYVEYTQIWNPYSPYRYEIHTVRMEPYNLYKIEYKYQG